MTATLSESERTLETPARAPEHDLITLTVRQAAEALGKSLRAVERSLIGKWGNKLPDGWTARKVYTETGVEWRIIPPPGFKVRKLEGDGETPPERSGLLERLIERSGPDWGLSAADDYQPTIVIDRTDEVERLLRELVNAQNELNTERRLHLEDLRLLAELQGSVRLLESKAGETQLLKDELKQAQAEFGKLKDDYLALLNLPWWKRLFYKRS